MPQERLVPITWEEGWDQADVLCLYFYGVEFTEEFGTFGKGEKYKSITVDYGNGLVKAHDDLGETIKKQSFKGIPIN